MTPGLFFLLCLIGYTLAGYVTMLTVAFLIGQNGESYTGPSEDGLLVAALWPLTILMVTLFFLWEKVSELLLRIDFFFWNLGRRWYVRKNKK